MLQVTSSTSASLGLETPGSGLPVFGVAQPQLLDTGTFMSDVNPWSDKTFNLAMSPSSETTYSTEKW